MAEKKYKYSAFADAERILITVMHRHRASVFLTEELAEQIEQIVARQINVYFNDNRLSATDK